MLGKDDSSISASITCLILDLLLVFSEPPFPHLYSDAINTTKLAGLLGGLEIVHKIPTVVLGMWEATQSTAAC